MDEKMKRFKLKRFSDMSLSEDVYYGPKKNYDVESPLPTDDGAMEEMVVSLLQGYPVKELSYENFDKVKDWIMDRYYSKKIQTNFELYDCVELVIRGKVADLNTVDNRNYVPENPIILTNIYRKQCNWDGEQEQ